MSKTDYGEEIEIIRTISKGRIVYHRKPDSKKYQFYETRKVLKYIFDKYVEYEGLRNQYAAILDREFKPIKDKKMYLAKYHVLSEDDRHITLDDGSIITKVYEGENHTVNSDGTVTISRKEE